MILHHNFVTHKDSWRNALERLVELEPDPEFKAFWKHELKAYDEAYEEFDEHTKKTLWLC